MTKLKNLEDVKFKADKDMHHSLMIIEEKLKQIYQTLWILIIIIVGLFFGMGIADCFRIWLKS